MATDQSTLEPMVLELDRREVFCDGEDWILTAYYEPTAESKTFVCWRRKNQPAGKDTGVLIEVDPAKVIDILRHPALYFPVVTQS